MARGAQKKAKSAKSSFTDNAAKSTNLEPGLPSFFQQIPRELQSVANRLPKDHVSLVHFERSPAALRRNAFMVPVILNSFITIILLCRVYYALPVYLNQMTTILGYETPWSVQTSELSVLELIKILGFRTFLLSVDYALFGLLGRWPYEFLFGDKYGRHVGCVSWKWEVGFQRPQEFVVRRGRKWDIPIFTSTEARVAEGKPRAGWTKEEELLVYAKCTSALSSIQTSKPALSLLDGDWDLDYSSMIELTELANTTELDEASIERVVFVPWQNKWFYWAPHKIANAAGASHSTTENDETVENFKKCLHEINCDDVFYRWIERVQYETAQTGGWSADNKVKAEQELRNMINDRHHDAEHLIAKLGGRANIPGLRDSD